MEKDVVLKLCKEHDVKFIRLWFTDILGFLKGFAITINELEGAIEEGMGFDGSSIQGYARIDESDMIAKPDLRTFQIIHEARRRWPDVRTFMNDGTPTKSSLDSETKSQRRPRTSARSCWS
jgi:glutamine synthetase